MRKLLALSILLSFNALAFEMDGIEVIYGDDNRRDLYEVRNQLFQKLASSTAGMIEKSNLKKSSQGFFEIADKLTLSDKRNVCSDERFAKQVVAPKCSGFLIAPDVLVTAGHCYYMYGMPEEECKNHAWVFDYSNPTSSSQPSRKIQPRNVYNCQKILAGKLDRLQDYAIIKLDRKVNGREPVKFRQRGILPAATPLVVIGHPSGLPMKISDKGSVTNNRNKNTFSTTLDTFQANSGSGVFNSRTGLLEGILVQGKEDYILKDANNPNSCNVLNVCDNNAKNCSAGPQSGSVSRGEVVFRIDVIQALLESALKD